MRYFSTRDMDRTHPVTLQHAVLSGLAEDGGLYMPDIIPVLPTSFFERLHELELPEVAQDVISAIVGDDLPEESLQSIVSHTFNFPIPVILVPPLSIIELFHGQTMAFKDVGARFMARVMGHFNASQEGDLHVIVATSGDTGGAVAAGFYQVPGVQVHILFPKGKVSRLQELQLTTWGANIHAYQVDGTFDDCQAISKQALSDPEVRRKCRITSANSINISRLIPQMVYYFWGASQWLAQNGKTLRDIAVEFNYSIPSGNFGNLTAGLFAKRMGLPVGRLIASTNANSVLPEYLESGTYRPRRSVKTLSNAMDVGNPSNYERMTALFNGEVEHFREMLFGAAFSDEEVVQEIQRVYADEGYHLDPHTAVAFLGMRTYLNQSKGQDRAHTIPSSHLEASSSDQPVQAQLILGTAHPVKFSEESDPLTGIESHTPPQAADFFGKTSMAEECSTSYEDVKKRILEKV